MRLADLINQIQQLFPGSDASILISALRKDPLIWETIQDEAFFEQVVKAGGNEIKNWSPANLALLTLGTKNEKKDGDDPSAVSENTTLEDDVQKIYQSVFETRQPPQTFQEIALLAIALGQKINQEKAVKTVINPETAGDLYQDSGFQTALACLFGLLDDPKALLKELLEQTGFPEGAELVSQILFSNPISEETRNQYLLELISGLDLSKQFEWIRSLNIDGVVDTARYLAEQVLKKIQETRPLDGQENLSELLSEKNATWLLNAQVIAGLLSILGKDDEAYPLLQKAQQTLKYWLTGVDLLMMETAPEADEKKTILEAIIRDTTGLAGMETLENDLAVISNHNLAGSDHWISELPGKSSRVKILNAVFAAKNGELESAQNMGRAAAAEMENPDDLHPIFLPTWSPAIYVKSLLDIGLTEEAKQFTQKAIVSRPTDVELIELMSLISEREGDFQKAYDYACLRVVFDSITPQHYRRGADLAEKLGDWQKVYEGRRDVLRVSEQPQTEDCWKYAQAALHLNDLRQIITGCSMVLKSAPEHLQANVLMSKTLIELGEMEDAERLLNRAIILIPETPELWLMLSDIYQKMGDPEKALETLRAGAGALPQSADINLALGQMYLDREETADALPYLQQAAQLMPEAEQVPLTLGNVYRKLGNYASSCEVLANAYEKWPDNPDLAGSLSRVYFDLRQEEKAIRPLETVLSFGMPGLEEYLMYAQAILGEMNPILISDSNPDTYEKIQDVLEKALFISPEHLQLRMFMAEVLAVRGHLNLAYDIYRQIISLDDIQNHEDYFRIACGFGYVCLKRGEAQTAVKYLEDVAGAEPGELAIVQLLAEAYLKSGQFVMALQTARAAKSLAPDQLENLLWFVDIAIPAGTKDESRETLEKACELLTTDQSESPDVFRRIAEFWESLENWQKSFEYRHKVVNSSPEPAVNDTLAYALCAIKTEEPQLTIEASASVLRADPDNGLANSLMGQALIQVGHDEEAVPFLEKATQFTPSSPEPWLLLTEYFQKKGDDQRALTVLTLACEAASTSAEINYAMSQAYLNKNMFAEALPYLKKAAYQSPEKPGCALELGTVLDSLGKLEEARLVLETACLKWPLDADLALECGKVLIKQGDYEAALHPMEVAIERGIPDFEDYIAYIETLFKNLNPALLYKSLVDSQNLDRGLSAIDKALNIKKDDFKANLMKAEILTARGDIGPAFQMYQKILEQPESNESLWHTRVQEGLGTLALRKGDAGTALALLKEAAVEKQEDVHLHRVFSEAYFEASLLEEALQTAKYTLTLAPEDFSNLSWFADIATRLGDDHDAIAILETVTQVAPELPEYWVQLIKLQLKLGKMNELKTSLKTLLGLKNLTSEHLRQSAYAFMRMNNLDDALHCIEEAEAVSPTPSADIFYEKACIKKKAGDLEGSLEAIQDAVANTSDGYKMAIFQADLLTLLGRPEEALESLKHAYKVLESESFDGTGGSSIDSIIVYSDTINEPDFTLVGVHVRLSWLYKQMGDMLTALHHAEQALELTPTSPSLRYLAADIAMSLVQYKHAEKILGEENTSSLPDISGIIARSPGMDAFLALYSLKAELALNMDDEQNAKTILEIGLKLIPNHPRMTVVRCRILAREGKWKEADELFSVAMTNYYSESSRVDTSDIPDYFGYSLIERCLNGREYWIADAVLEVQRWDEALQLYEKIAAKHPGEARAAMSCARALAICAETQRLYQELGSTRHTPGKNKLSKEAGEKFERYIAEAAKNSNSKEIERWLIRGTVAFHLNIQNIRQMQNLPQYPDDTTAIVAALRQVNNLPIALGVCQHLSDTPSALMQSALCYLPSNPQKALEVIQKAVDAAPEIPLYHAVKSMAEEKLGQTFSALEALEQALIIWDDEVEWHARAAHLAMKNEDPESALAHWEQAFWLNPTCVDYALELGKIYLMQNEISKAITVLDNACRLDQERADAWVLLASACQRAGKLDEALENVNHARLLQPSDSRVYLTSAQIVLEKGETALAEEYARTGLNFSPTDEETILFLARLLKREGKLAESLQVVENGVSRLPRSALLGYEQAVLILEIRGVRAALPIVQSIVKYHPDDIRLLEMLANLQSEIGDFEGAEEASLAALKLNPEQPQMNYLLGKLKHKAGHLDQAISSLSEAIRLNPKEIGAYLELGKVYQDMREESLALNVYHQAVQNVPGDARPYYDAAVVLRGLKNYVEAETMLRKASELSPDDLNIRRQLGAVIALNLVHHVQEASTSL